MKLSLKDFYMIDQDLRIRCDDWTRAKLEEQILGNQEKLEKIKELCEKYHEINYTTFNSELKEILGEKE